MAGRIENVIDLSVILSSFCISFFHFNCLYFFSHGVVSPSVLSFGTLDQSKAMNTSFLVIYFLLWFIHKS